jgi:phenylpropionate dioxygenase-like ring-hydroxylating dioxygenase large terminal subunit
MNTTLDLHRLIEDEGANGRFRVHRDLFTSPEIFDLEMRYIFEAGWVFVALESQIAKPFDYVCTQIGRQPVIVTRDENGQVHVLFNSCRHKGARIAQREAGNAPLFVCPYHSWTYRADGRLRGIKDRAGGLYPPAFETEDHDLQRAARVEAYRGLIFASLNENVESLADYLGDSKVFIDLAMDQGEHGMELVPGRTYYTFDANWKLQMENGIDPYHLTSAHQSFIRIIDERKTAASSLAAIKSRDFRQSVIAESGAFAFRNGHGAVWIDNLTPEQKPIHRTIDALRARVGEHRARWMLNFRNLTLFPNLQLADSESMLLRVIKPLSPTRTEMRVYCMAPIGEDPEARRLRLRQHEDFFNATGLATPDDTALYEECQNGFLARHAGNLQGYDRGEGAARDRADKAAQALGITPERSVTGAFAIQSEIQFRPLYRRWRAMMQAGRAREAA